MTMIYQTSGTTGPAKKFNLSAAQIDAQADRFVSVKGPEFATLKSLYVALPASAPVAERYREYCARAGVRYIGVARGFWESVALLKSGVDGIVGGPIDLQRFARAINGSYRFKYILASGSLLNPQVAREIGEKILAEGGAAYVSYGASETGQSIARGTFMQAEAIEGCVGSICDGAQIRFVNGQIEAKTAVMIDGYLDPELTAERFTADGWFRTGDKGYFTPDNLLVLQGRI